MNGKSGTECNKSAAEAGSPAISIEKENKRNLYLPFSRFLPPIVQRDTAVVRYHFPTAALGTSPQTWIAMFEATEEGWRNVRQMARKTE